MQRVHLTDLDELALTVRDRIAQSYILEAITAYRGGAYRASIVSAWVAVSFDVISKIRELSDQGDGAAQKFIKNVDGLIEAKKIKPFLKIEEDILETATKDFEFLSAQEKSDLDLLRNDRHLCAHPAFVSEEVLFEPEPERVRMHIIHVVKHLLQHQPVQGKSAIEKIVRDIKSRSFPITLETACVFLNSRYLDRAKKSLVENLVLLLLKATLRGDLPDLPLTYSRQILLALQAIARRHPDIYEERMKAKFLTIVESLEESQLPHTFRLLGSDPRCWDWLDNPTKIHLKSVTQINLSSGDLRNSIFEATRVSDLKPIIIEGFNTLPSEIQRSVIKTTPQPEFAARAITLYSEASSYRGAERLGESLILPMINCFSMSDIKEVLEVVQENNQIYEASGTPAIIGELFEQTKRHLPDLRKSWEALFEFLFSRYEYEGWEEDEDDFWEDRGWESLANQLRAVGVKVAPDLETDDG